MPIRLSSGFVLFLSLSLPFLFRLFSSFSFSVMSSSVLPSSSPVQTVSKLANSRVDQVLDRIRGSLWGVLIGDALAMPAHWYYDTNLLKKTFGKIESYLPAPTHLRGSILNLSNTNGGGRGSDSGDLIGTVIMHGKHKYWKRGGDYHYHQGLKAGENTLDAMISRVIVRGLTDKKVYDHKYLRQQYVDFMTTPGTHNDTYANTCHRQFFANYRLGRSLDECPDNDGHNTDAIDGMTNVPAVAALAWSQHGPFGAQKAATQTSTKSVVYDKEEIVHCVQLFRKTQLLRSYAAVFSYMLTQLWNEPLNNPGAGQSDLSSKENSSDSESGATAATTASDFRKLLDNVGVGLGIRAGTLAAYASDSSDPMSACYIDSAFESLLVIAYKYADKDKSGQKIDSSAACDAGASFEGTLIANTNAGGENVARGAALGALLGARVGYKNIPEWMKNGLLHKEEINKEIEQFITVVKENLEKNSQTTEAIKNNL